MKRFDSPFSTASDAPSPSGAAPAASLGGPNEAFNPFAADVCPGPYGVDEARSVPGMNADLLRQLTSAVDERAGPQRGQPLLLLTAPRAGYGKTHLLGRMAAAAEDQAVIVPVAFRSGDAVDWKSVARRGVEAMDRAEAGMPGWTKLREACGGVVASLLRRLIEDGRLPCANPQQAVRVLSGPVEDIFDPKGSAHLIGQWLMKHAGQLRKPLAERVGRQIGLADTNLAADWFQTIYDLGTQGEAPSAAMLKQLATSDAEGCQRLLRLLAIWRPVVVLVDHLDAFYRNADAGLKIASLLLDLTEVDGVHVVLSLNQDVWQATFGHHLPSALEDRLTASQMLLRGLTATEALALVRLRLKDAQIAEAEASAFERFLDVNRYFMGRPLGSVAARSFLRHASQQWQAFVNSGGGAAPQATLLEDEEDGEEGGMVLPDVGCAPMPSPSSAGAPSFSVFDAATSNFMRNAAESLTEPVAALPQNEISILPVAPGVKMDDGPPVQPPSIKSLLPTGDAPLRDPAATLPSSTHLPEPPQAPPAPEAQSTDGNRSLGNFEKLREMLDRLRRGNNSNNGSNAESAPVQAATPPAPPVVETTPSAESVAQKLAGVMGSTTPSGSSEIGQSALLERFEALKQQMMPEAESRSLDLSRIAELVRLAGRRFPLVRFSENELPGQTGRHVMNWSLQGMDIVFGLAPFNDHVWWQTLSGYAAGKIATGLAAAARTGDQAPTLKIVAFKSDRDTAQWAQFQDSGVLPGGLRHVVDPIHVDTRSVASLYAMQRIIKEAESGALPAQPAQVMSVLARELDFFWKRVTRPMPVAS